MLWAQRDGKIVFRHAVGTMLGALMRACTHQNIGVEDIDLFLFHQANMRINQFIAQQIGVGDEKIPHNIQRYGNTTAATIPILLAECVREGKLRPGMKVAMAAFGSGFTWGAAIIDW
jgi:3-oxoacyl-[acyl-carrier-protein] synthase-3